MRLWKTGSIEPIKALKKLSGFGVYKIESNGCIYIGGTKVAFRRRWKNHLHELRKGVHHNFRLQNAFTENGEESFKFSILEIVEKPEEVTIIEQKYIDELKPEFNICLSAANSVEVLHKEEVRRKIALALKTEQTKQRIKDALKKRHSNHPEKAGCKNIGS